MSRVIGAALSPQLLLTQSWEQGEMGDELSGESVVGLKECMR